MLMRGVSTSIIALVVVVVIAVAGVGFYVVSQPGGQQQTQTTPTTSTTSTSSTTAQRAPPPGSKQAFDTHLSNIHARDVPAALSDYVGSATVLWTGNTGGLSGIYIGTGNIRLLLASALSTAQQISLAPSDYIVKNNSASRVTVNATLDITGQSQYLGRFNGTVEAQSVFTYSNGAWKISNENWYWKSLVGSQSGGATTFPEWQKVGPINPSRRSADWLHNFAWDYGGIGTALVIYSSIALIGVVGVLRRRGKSSK
jgi:hypothetical protein